MAKDIELDSSIRDVVKSLPDSYKKHIKGTREKDGSMTIVYSGSQDEIVVKELEKHFKDYADKKGYIKSVGLVKVLKKSIKYTLKLN